MHATTVSVDLAKDVFELALADRIIASSRASGCRGQRFRAIEARLAEFAHRDVASQHQQVPGIGVITAAALRANVGDLQRFRSGRHFAAWLGLPPREHSSGRHRRRN